MSDTPKYCLFVCGPSSAEDKLLDLLMEFTDQPFEIGPMFTHGAAHGRLQSDELVSGRAAAVQAQLLVNAGAALDSLVARLRQDFVGAGLRYWAVPVAIQGEIE